MNSHIDLKKRTGMRYKTEICKKWEIRKVSELIDILGLMGDAADNIPGIPGVGEKTAIK